MALTSLEATGLSVARSLNLTKEQTKVFLRGYVAGVTAILQQTPPGSAAFAGAEELYRRITPDGVPYYAVQDGEKVFWGATAESVHQTVNRKTLELLESPFLF